MALTVTAGNPATAAQYNALIPYYLAQGSDQALSTTTFTDHNTFAAIPFAASQTWHCVCVMSVLTANVGNDIKHKWNVTGGATIAKVFSIGPGPTTTVLGDGTFYGLAYPSGSQASTGALTDATYGATTRFEFIVVTTTSGTVTLQWAQNAAVSGSTTVKLGSFFVAHRLV